MSKIPRTIFFMQISKMSYITHSFDVNFTFLEL